LRAGIGPLVDNFEMLSIPTARTSRLRKDRSNGRLRCVTTSRAAPKDI
jgi:hypothetical protein